MTEVPIIKKSIDLLCKSLKVEIIFYTKHYMCSLNALRENGSTSGFLSSPFFSRNQTENS